MSWGPLQIILILAIVLLLFGTKKLRNLGSDLGSAIKGFKKSISDTGDEDKSQNQQQSAREDNKD